MNGRFRSGVFKMIMARIVIVTVCAISFSAARADECVDAKNAQRIISQNSERAIKKSQAKVDAIKCCSAAYYRVQCDYQKLFLEQVQADGPLMEKVARACDKRELSGDAKKQQEAFVAQVTQLRDSDCERAEDSRKREAEEKKR
jgi:hypothetical protein